MLCGALGGSLAQAEEFTTWTAPVRPPLVLDRLDGPRTDLSELSGKPVIVHFFATWCAPCIAELASLNALAAETRSDVAILAVDVGEVDARLRNFLRERPVTFPVLLDRDRAAMKSWRVESLPASFVLDRGLVPALKVEGPLDWQGAPVVQALAGLSRGAVGALSRSRNENREIKP